MKCVHCDKDAVYILKGNSLCAKCKDKETEAKSIAKDLLKQAGSQYRGNTNLLKALFKEYSRFIKDDLSDVFRYRFVVTLIDAIEKYDISPSNIDTSIKIAIKQKKFTEGFIIYMMKLRQENDNKLEKQTIKSEATNFYLKRLEQEENERKQKSNI